MKKVLTFIPLGIGISAAIIYVFNILSFRAINNTIAMNQILLNLRLYLYVSIVGFLVYGLIKIINIFSIKKKNNINYVEKAEEPKIVQENKVEDNTYVPNYDYVPLYKPENNNDEYISVKKDDNIISLEMNNKKEIDAYEPLEIREKEEIKVSLFKKYCTNCGNEIDNSNDSYCAYCGESLKEKKKGINPFIKNVINVLEIVILILIIYFSLNMLFNYKEKIDSNFKSPFKVQMTK